MTIIIGRHPEGITLNPLEYLLDAPEPKGKPMEFKNERQAREFLKSKGVAESNLDAFVYQEVEP